MDTNSSVLVKEYNESPHVEYILLAEFDIGIGSSLTHQYPKKTDMSEQILAEMMLPDGVHQRSEDWTIFFLNQSPNMKIETITNEDGTFPEVEPKNLIYVLSLVITKHDREAVRGAHVKAMAICTRHRFLHIYKPVLLLALENYFRNPSIDVLKTLYQAVNDMDVSLMPHFSISEKMVLRASEDKDMFEEKFLAMEEQANLVSELNQLSLNSNTTIESTGKRSTFSNTTNDTNKRQTFIDLSSGLRKEVQSGLGGKNKDRHFFETAVTYEKVKIPIRVPLTIYPEEVGDFSLINLITTFANAPIVPHPFHPHLDTAGPNTHPLIILLNALLTEKRVIFLGHGLPSGQVANYVLAACAMASGSGIVLKGFLERAFPYTSLSDIDALLKFRGFIAGVANPTFEGHPKWWDVLCNISTGKILVSPFVGSNETLTTTKRSSNSTSNTLSGLEDDNSIASFDASHNRQPSGFTQLGANSANSTNALNFTSNPVIGKEKGSNERWDNSDNEFIQEVLQAIQNHYGELSIRAKFADYIQRFVGIAALYEEEFENIYTRIGITHHNTPDPTSGKYLGYGIVFSDEQSKLKEIQANLPRIEGWRHTLSYIYYAQDFQKFLKTRAIKQLHPQRQIAKLRVYKSIPDKELEAIYKAFLDFIVTSEQIIEFLAAVPQNQGGLTPITVALFHPNKTIRNYTVQFLNRIDQHQTGTRFIQNLNLFHKLAYERQCLAYEVNDNNFKILQPYIVDGSKNE